MAAAPSISPLPAPQTVAARRRQDSTLARLIRHPLFVFGLIILLGLLLLATLAPLIGRGDPQTIYPKGLDSLGVPSAPGGEFKLGADTLGRDVWTRVLYGAQLSLLVAFCAMITSTVIGTTIGLLGGFFRRLGRCGFDALHRNRGGVTDDSVGDYAHTVVLPKQIPGFWLFQKIGHQSRFEHFEITAGDWTCDVGRHRARGARANSGIARARVRRSRARAGPFQRRDFCGAICCLTSRHISDSGDGAEHFARSRIVVSGLGPARSGFVGRTHR